MRKFVSAIAAAGCLGIFAGPALAQSSSPTPTGLTVSNSTVTPGGRVVIRGSGAAPGAMITLRLSRLEAGETVSLGRVLAAPEGRFRATVTIPKHTSPGVYTLPASSGEVVLGMSMIRVVSASIGGFPFMGATVLPGLAGGAFLITAGGLLLISLRRLHRIA